MVAIPTGTWVDNNVDAGELRKSLGAALIVPAAGVNTPRAGRLMGPSNPLAVSPTAPASMAVLVKGGKAHLYRSAAYGPILGVGPDGDVTVPITAPGTGSQWYRIYIAQRDASTPANDVDSLAVVDAVAGAAAASPTKPNLPAGALLLGEVLVPAGATSITAAMVADIPVYTAPRGTPVPVTGQADRDTMIGYAGLECIRLDTSNHRRERWTTSGWVPTGLSPWTASYVGPGATLFAPDGFAIHGAAPIDPAAIFGAGMGAVVHYDARVLLDVNAGTGGWYLNVYGNASVLLADDFKPVSGRVMLSATGRLVVPAGTTQAITSIVNAPGVTNTSVKIYADAPNNRLELTAYPIYP